MRKIGRKIVILVFASISLISCDILNVDADREVFADEYNLKSANDTLYSMFGVFSQLQKLSNSYVVLGELRADLMDVTDGSDVYLKEINNWTISSDNKYVAKTKDYYAVINSCNYVINNIDTSIVKGFEKVMYREFAACKAIRAWTYMQLALNYGSVKYYEKPILSLSDAEAVQQQSSISFDELAAKLIDDLKPYKQVPRPNFGSLFTFDTRNGFFPIRFLLGDLYLWTGQYENAANEYHDLMVDRLYTLDNSDRNEFTVVNGAFTGGVSAYSMINSTSDKITSIASTNQDKSYFSLDSLTLNRKLIPSKLAMRNWDSQRYFYGYSGGKVVDTISDTRKYSYTYTNSSYNTLSEKSDNFIANYLYLNSITRTVKTDKEVVVYRVPLLYLRYAEAVNRLGKPNLAFAVLKYGLTSSNIFRYVPASERGATLPNYMVFPNSIFDFYFVTQSKTYHFFNTGVRMRGCGNVNADTTYYKIPTTSSIGDSIKFVEDKIEQELSLETAFGGNRFHDLMRFAIRRNDNAYLADKIAAKHKDNAEAIRKTLMERSNWYLKK